MSAEKHGEPYAFSSTMAYVRTKLSFGLVVKAGMASLGGHRCYMCSKVPNSIRQFISKNTCTCTCLAVACRVFKKVAFLKFCVVGSS